MLKAKQRKYLEKAAHELQPTAHVGRAGVTETVLESVKQNIEKNELIKIRVKRDSGVDKREAAEKIAEYVDGEVVRIIGHLIILFRQDPEESRFDIPE